MRDAEDGAADEDADEEEDEGEEDEGEEEEIGSSTLLDERWHQVGPITAEYLYTGEVFNNARGGISHAKGHTLSRELRPDT